LGYDAGVGQGTGLRGSVLSLGTDTDCRGGGRESIVGEAIRAYHSKKRNGIKERKKRKKVSRGRLGRTRKEVGGAGRGARTCYALDLELRGPTSLGAEREGKEGIKIRERKKGK